ncbi:amyloid beta precursor protein binding family B member 1-like isoform X3 [Episyrphus balteatus]|uniref:amyloid beta precursor protein binding family B member 1-like isoform X3 n=1 Tax=Episyrphus balteatus TaxID=286459 RepID=UPI002486BCE6|nr:amyloid beta precursor protein binding family B member 1-like isoform X3 [Episyrphus balteatus]
MNKQPDFHKVTMNQEQLQNYTGRENKSVIGSNRKDYAKIDFGSMGVNLKEHFMSAEKKNFFNYSPSLDLKVQSNQHVDLSYNVKSKPIGNPTTKYISGNINSEILRALRNKKFEKSNFGLISDALSDKKYAYYNEEEINCTLLEGIEEKDRNKDLPMGWEKHEDNDGPYYWHIKSGTIQREPPIFPQYKYINDEKDCKTPGYEYENNSTVDHYDNLAVSPTYSRSEMRGKNMYMDLEDGSLKLVETDTLTVLNSQPIHTIRVWGVGRDNGRDFAYVSRDRLTRVHMCHVFRCDTAARTIANTLRDICKQIMIERSIQLDSNIQGITSGYKTKQESFQPKNLKYEPREFRHSQSFPIPMEEPKKILKALYVGCKDVSRPTGMEIINEAINSVISESRNEDWENVNVVIAPSMITVRSSKDYGRLIAECRVRYLSFLGIGKNFKKCAFIVHTARNKFVAHVFHCEPSSGALCKTVEAACKLRYQKCLDAHPENSLSFDSSTSSKGIGATIKDIINSLSLKKDKCDLP